MAFDPRLNLTASAQFAVGPVSISIGAGVDACPTSIGENLFATTSSYENLSSILPGNIGAFANLQLGEGGGIVGAGLTNLAAISDSIRVNGSSPAMPAGLNGTAGSEFVLQQVGLSSQGLSAVAQVNTGIAASANAQASIVFNQVQSGTFTNANIPAAFSPFQNASQLLSASFSIGVGASPPGSQFGTMCGASQYAIDLINLAPKYKFLFVIQLEFHPQFQEVLQSIDPAFVVKHSTRPQVDFEYQDVNMYNFRTKVPTKTIYQPMTMKFYDDDFNNAFQFYATYMKLMSPIANLDIQTQAIEPLDAYDNYGGGMGFGQNTFKIQTGWSKTVGQSYAASLGPYGQVPVANTSTNGGSAKGVDVKNVLRRISLFQVYKQGTMMNVFHFYNPKITVLNLDEMDMSTSGDGNEVTITFSYDSVYIIPGYSLINGPLNLASITNDGIYPFGIQPGTVSPAFNQKDGLGRGGIDYGQNNVGNVSTATSSMIQVPSSVTNFNPTNPTTGSGTSFANLPSTTPSSGGNNTASGLQGNSTDDLSEITTTAQRLPDPTTGPQQNSADNSGDIGNAATTTTQNNTVDVTTATNNVATAQSALTEAQANVNTAQYQYNTDPSPETQTALASATAAAATAQNNLSVAQSQLSSAKSMSNNTTVPSTIFNSVAGTPGEFAQTALLNGGS